MAQSLTWARSAPWGMIRSSTRLSAVTPGGRPVAPRTTIAIRITAPIPMPSETTLTNENARAFASERSA